MDEDTADTLAGVGAALRARRLQEETTLAELAATTGISVSTLSRLENGQRRPTLELLLPIARAFGASLDELVEVESTEDPRVPQESQFMNGKTVTPLSRRPGGIRAYKQVFPPGYPHAEVEQRVHDGYEWLYVMAGRLRLVLGEHDLVLEPGEVAEFDTRIPHAFANPFPEPAEVIGIFGPQGERMHVRARSTAPGDPDHQPRGRR